ncbi:hypothetical protein N0V88_003788 [Collariella sp. IMI 366227]|nr:hypothetical protein N0V88_003788 [Collariella sp. IMI 366227]
MSDLPVEHGAEASRRANSSADANTRKYPVDYGSLEALLPVSWKTQIDAWLAEDTPSFDVGGYVVGDEPRIATLWGKSTGILAGVPFFNEVFKQCGCTVEWGVPEGTYIVAHGSNKKALAVVKGPARGLLEGERVALNILARCSGIADVTRRLRVNLDAKHFKGTLAGTRKTTPGFRLVEKYGMLVGGADTHRMDLSTMTMLKDNHIWSRGNDITAAVEAAKAVGGFSLKVEVEVQSEEDAEKAIEAGADIVMLDNFGHDEVKVVAQSLKQKYKGKREFLLEVSGGLTEETVHNYVHDDIDILSTSAIHQGVPHVDFSLKIKKLEVKA